MKINYRNKVLFYIGGILPIFFILMFENFRANATSAEFEEGTIQSFEEKRWDLNRILKSIKLETQEIMVQISKSMPDKLDPLKQELFNLKSETKNIREYILSLLNANQFLIKPKNQIFADKLRQHRIYADMIHYQIDAALKNTAFEFKGGEPDLNQAFNESKKITKRSKQLQGKLFYRNHKPFQTLGKTKESYRFSQLGSQKSKNKSKKGGKLSIDHSRSQSHDVNEKDKSKIISELAFLENARANRKKKKDKNRQANKSKSFISKNDAKKTSDEFDEFSDKKGNLLVTNDDSYRKEKIHLVKLSRSIKRLKKRLGENSWNQVETLKELGSVYRESSKYLNSLTHKSQLDILQFAYLSNTILGSREMSLLTYQIALKTKPWNGKSNLAVSELYDEAGRGIEAKVYATRAEHSFRLAKNFDGTAKAHKMAQRIFKKYDVVSADF